jgi:hypothetical protein
MARWWILAVVAVMSVGAFACGSDEDGGSTGGASGASGSGGSGGTGGSGGSAGSGGTAGSGGGQPNVVCDPTGDGVCENDNDCPIVSSGAARAAAQSCGISCLMAGDPSQCANDCVVADTGLSAECAACYTGIVACSSENCLTECLADPAGAACAQCQVDAGCRAAFDQCSGLPPSQ